MSDHEHRTTRYGWPVSDPAVQRIADLLLTMPDHRELLVSLACAATAYEREGNAEELAAFARDVLATAELRAVPGYDKTLRARRAATRGAPALGHDVREVFGRLREA